MSTFTGRRARYSYKWLLLLVILSLTAYFFVPQLDQLGSVIGSARAADPVWLLAAIGASVLTYYMATAVVIGSTKRQLPWNRTLVVQLASTIPNRITPKGIGTAAFTERYLEKEGCKRPEAIAAVTVMYAAGVLMHISVLITVFVIVRPSTEDFKGLNVSPQHIIIAAAIMVATVVGMAFIPRIRQPILHWGLELRHGLRYIASRPVKLIQLLGGSAGITLSYSIALFCSMAALDIYIPFVTVILIYLASGVAALASPAPGGLGATEAALAFGLSAVGVPLTEAITGVLIFRLASFWFPILPGLAALRYVTTHRYI